MEGISTLGRLADVTPERAKVLLGSRGPAFVRWAKGEDDRPVDRLQPPRSLVREVTLPVHEPPSPLAATEADLHDVVRHLADVLAMRLARDGLVRPHRVAAASAPPSTLDGPAPAPVGPKPVMVRSVTLREATALGEDLRAAALSLLKVLWRRQPVGGVALVVSNLQAAGPQMPLFPLSAPEATAPTAETLRARSGLRVLVDERVLGGRPPALRSSRRGAARSAASPHGLTFAGRSRQGKLAARCRRRRTEDRSEGGRAFGERRHTRGGDQLPRRKTAAETIAILDALATQHPNAWTELDHTNAFELLVATILSAQSSDQRVNGVPPPSSRATRTRRRSPPRPRPSSSRSSCRRGSSARRPR
jgi:hypothetical protein